MAFPYQRGESCSQRVTEGVAGGLFLGSVLGAVKSNWQSMPKVVSNKAWPALQATIGLMGAHAALFGAVAAAYTVTECAAETVSGTASWKNGALGGAAAGAVMGLRSGNVGMGFACAGLFATVSALADTTGGKLRVEDPIGDGVTPPRPYVPAKVIESITN